MSPQNNELFDGLEPVGYFESIMPRDYRRLDRVRPVAEFD